MNVGSNIGSDLISVVWQCFMYTTSSGQCWECVRGQGLVCGMWNIYQTFPTKAYSCGHDVVCFFVHCRAIHDGVILPATSNSQFPNMNNGRQIDDIDIDKIRDSIVVSISACHAEDPGSIPGRGISLQGRSMLFRGSKDFYIGPLLVLANDGEITNHDF